jgi:acetoin utilization deacetylase AcuC-like enzyme
VKPAALISHPDCGRHDTGWGHPEHMGRLPAVIRALYRDTPALLDHVLQHEARSADESQLLRVHTAAAIDLVRRTALEAERTGTPIRIEADTVVSGASWDAALGSAGCGVDAVDLVLTGRARNALALCRPPGHHATADRSMGFCLFNNIAIATRHAQAVHGVERVLIVDWDVHHGNGTQDIFYHDGRVYYLSLHLEGHYPGTGAAEERGAGGGHGWNLNVPLPTALPAANYRAHFDAAIAQAFAEARPQLVMVSGGFDCLSGDPLGGLLLEPSDLYAMTESVLALARPLDAAVVVLLEGGYAPDRTGAATVATMRALAGIPL